MIKITQKLKTKNPPKNFKFSVWTHIDSFGCNTDAATDYENDINNNKQQQQYLSTESKMQKRKIETMNEQF